MIKYVKGNIWANDSDIIVIPVDCGGVMGKGLALQFKKKYLCGYYYYRKMCGNNNIETSAIKIGNPLVTYTEQCIDYIFFPTKQHWENKSKIEDIDIGLQELRDYLSIENYFASIWECDCKSISIPALGCGCGGLDWKDVKILIERYLSDFDNDITVYCPIDEEE